MLSRLLLLTGTGLLVSCGRPENAEYFTKVTGLPLCNSAVVENVNSKDLGRSPGFDSIYVVDIRMSPACKDQLIDFLRKKKGLTCRYYEKCGGKTIDGEFFAISDRNDKVRFIHST